MGNFAAVNHNYFITKSFILVHNREIKPNTDLKTNDNNLIKWFPGQEDASGRRYAGDQDL